MADELEGARQDGGKRGRSPGLIGAVACAVVLVVFVMQNTHRTRVSFLLWDRNPPLWFALLVTAALAVGAAELAARYLRHRRHRED